MTKEFCKSVDDAVLKAAKRILDLPELQEWQNYHGRINNYISNSKRGKHVTVSRINPKNGAKM